MKITNTNSISFDSKSTIHDIEYFVESICDQILVNETYFGNILMSLSEIYNIWSSQPDKNTLSISYTTDFLTLMIVIDGVNQDYTDILSSPIKLDKTQLNPLTDQVFLVQNLADSLKITDQLIQLSFDISALHNSISQQRSTLLRSYLGKTKSIEVKLIND